MKQEILDFITKKGGSVSFAELSREVTGFDGDMTMFVGPEANNIILWSGISTAAADALDELRGSGAIHADPTPLIVYLVDGRMPRLPIVKQARSYKKPHWLPVTFSLGPMPPPKPKVPVARPNQITPTKLDLASMSAADLRAHFEPLELCPNGFNSVPGECAKNWDRYDSLEAGSELVQQVLRAREWLMLCDQAKTIYRDATSYGLKHEAERWCRSQGHPHGGYVSNGALLMAAHGLGFRISRPAGHSNFPNAFINIKKKRPTP